MHDDLESRLYHPNQDGGNGLPDSKHIEGRDRDHEACRNLWVAVIHKAMKDMAYASAKSTQRNLTPGEREKLGRIFEIDTPESFFHSNWFEEICRYLELSASRIRAEVLSRYSSPYKKKY